MTIAPSTSALRLNPQSERLAAVYAKALLGAAERAGHVEKVMEDFDAFVTEVLDLFPKLEQQLSSSRVVSKEKIKLIDRLAKGRVTATFLNFLKVVAQRGRLDVIRYIQVAAHQRFDHLHGIVQVEVRTALKLSEEELPSISDRLREQLGREPRLNVRVDPNLIGGIQLQIGDKVFGGTVKNQLDRLRNDVIGRFADHARTHMEQFVST